MVTNPLQMMTQNPDPDRDWKKKTRGAFSLGWIYIMLFFITTKQSY